MKNTPEDSNDQLQALNDRFHFGVGQSTAHKKYQKHVEHVRMNQLQPWFMLGTRNQHTCLFDPCPAIPKLDCEAVGASSV